MLILIYLAIMTVEFDHWYTGAGLLQGAEAREAAAPLRFSPLQYVDDPQIAHAFLAFTVHGGRRLHAGLAYPDHEHFALPRACSRFTTVTSGPTAARTLCPMILTFYMMLCPCGAAYSLDALRAARKRGTAAEPLIVPWAVRLLQMQICLIYFQSCVIKCQGPLWLNGTVGALHSLPAGVPRVRPGMAGAVSAL